MAINKRKVLDNARKLAQKGAKQKALKEYNTLVQADPRDTKLLLEIGDVYRRWGQAEEAIAQYTRVANQYKQDGFDARAVAVLKQILNLDPKRYASHVTLAELYQRMGLDSEAIGALQTAADGYYREGRRREALELLRKMAALDPSNTTSRLKVADLLRQEGMEDDAVLEYEEVVDELTRQGAGENVCVVQERILEIRADHVPTLSSLARNLSDLGRPERAERFAVRALELAKEPEQFELLAGIYKGLGNEARLAEVTRELATYYKTRGDEDRAREVLQRLPPEAVVPAGGFDIGRDRSEFDDSEVGEDELLEDEDFLVADASDQSELLELEQPATVAKSAAREDPPAEIPDGDPEQLLAEASVYLRYGKRAQAIASLKGALRQAPEHRGVLEKLGEAHAEEGEEDDAIGCWQRAAELARRAGDAEAFGILRDRIGALDPVAAGELEPMPDDEESADDIGLTLDAEGASDEDRTRENLAPDLDDEFDLSIDVSEVETDEAAAGGASIDLDEADGDSGLELELDLDGPGTEDDPVDSDADSASEAGVDLAGGIEVEVDLDGDDRDLFGNSEDDADDAIDLADDEPDVAAATRGAPHATSSQFGQSTTTAAQIKEDLEEAEFYIQQGLASEAEAIYRRVLATAPNHPTAMLKLGELAAERGDDPAQVSDAGIADAASSDDDRFTGGTHEIAFDDETEEVEVDAGASADADTGMEFEIDLDDDGLGADPDDDTAEIRGAADPDPEPSEDLQAILAEAEAAVDATEDADLEFADGGSLDASNALSGEVTERQFDDDEAASRDGAGVFGEDATEVEEPTDPGPRRRDPRFSREPVQAEPEPADSLVDDTMPLGDVDARPASRAKEGGSEASFDLAAELADVFEEEDANAVSLSRSARSTVEDGFESLFSDFKKGVSATLDEGDYDTRFDLGIAYREMGLFDDALGEFTVCLGSPTRKLECLHMMALCSMELGRHRDAISHIEQALASGNLPPDQTVALQFDLGRVQRRAGDLAAARHSFAAVQQADARFRGLADELAALEAAGQGTEPELELDEPREPFESFDDLLGDDSGEDAAAAEPETFESFDDVITEAESGDPFPEPEPEREPEREPAPAVEPEAIVEPDPPADPGASRPGRRKKKISFV